MKTITSSRLTTNRIRTQSKSLTHRSAMRATLFIAISLTICLLPAMQATIGYVKSTSPVIRVHATSQGRTLLNLQEARQASVDYHGSVAASEALRSGTARPLSLVSGDFDSDGAPDLVGGYGYNGGGIIAMRRGKLDAFQTQDLKVYQRALKGEVANSLDTSADVYQLPESPDFLMVGDFDGDGRQDVLAAAQGGGLYFLAGDGAARLGTAEQIKLNGTVTAVAAGNFNRGSERTSVVVATDGPGGPGLLVFEGEEGGLSSASARFTLSGPATALVLGKLDNDSFTDLAVAVGNKVEIIHGWGWTNTDRESRVEEIGVPFDVRSLAIGDFIWDREARPELALLSPDGNVHIFQRGQLDSRAFTAADKPALVARRVAASHAPMLTLQQQIELQEQSKWDLNAKEAWSDAQQLAALSASGNLSPRTLMTGSHTTGRRTDDLFVLDAQSQQVHIWVDTSLVSEPSNPRVPVSLAVDGSPLSVMAMPQKINASRDLLVLSSAHSEPGNIVLAPQAIFTVTQTADRASTCGTGGQCSLREAINSANNAAGTNTVAFSVNGTFTNTLGAFPAQGDVNSTNITILGNSPANTVIANTGSGPNHSVLYYGFADNQTFKVQNLTLQNGNTGDGFGGGAFATGGLGWLVTVDNCVLNNNISQSTDNGGAISHSGGGNFVIQNNTIISNNTATAAIGGGICVNNSTNVGGLTVTDSAFTGNTATTGAGAGQGGGLWIGVESSGSSAVTITRATITGNAAGSQQGGGIFTNKGTIQFSRIVGNTSVTGGSGVHEPAGGFTVTANNNWWGCNTGPGGAATGGCSVIPNSTSGFTAPTAWLQLRNVISGANVHNANQIAPTNGNTATFTGDILGLNTGGSTAAGNLTGLATFPNPAATIYSNGSPALGSIDVTSSQYVNGQAASSTTFTANGTKGTATVNAIADNQTFGSQLVIGFTPEFVNPAGSDATPFAAGACGGGANFPCYATVGAALTNVAISGIINIQAGTYAESPNFNQNATTVIAGNVSLNSITLTNGTFNAQSFTTTVSAGNFTNNGGTFTQGTSTFAFTPGAGAQTIGGSNATTFNGLTINNASGVNLGNSVTVGGALTLTNGALGVGTNTLTLNSTVSFASGTITSGATGTVNYNQGSNGQAVAPGTYGNLTFSNFNKTLPPSGTVGIASTFTTGSAVGHTITGSTIDFNGAGSQTIPAFLYNNLTSSNSGARTLASSGTIGIAEIFTPGTNVYTITGSTINFNGSGAQTIPAFNYNNLTSSSTGARTLASSGTVGIAGTFTPGTNVYTITGSTIDFNGAGGQTIPAFLYNNLTSSNSGARTLANSGTIGIAAVFTPGTNAYTITGSTIDFNGAGGQTIPAFNYNNLTSSNSGARTLAGSGTIRIAATFTPGTNSYTITGSTVEYNGSALQALPSTFTTYNNLTLNNPAGTTGFAGLTVNGLLLVAAGTFTSSSSNYNNVQINLTSTLSATAASTINVTGTWTNNGAFNANTGTVIFNGAGAQTIGGTAVTTFNNLTIANAGAGVSLGQNVIVNGLLTLTNDLSTGANTLTMPPAATSGPATNAADVVGNVKRTGFVSGGSALSFGNPFNTIRINSGAAPADINVNLVKSSPVGFSSAVQRTYTITPNGANGPATLRLHYLDSELNGNTPETSLNLRRFNGTGWAPIAVTASFTGDATNNWLENNAVSSFSAWTFSIFSPTAANGSISGRIVAADGSPVVGSVVRLIGTQQRKTITDANGNYRFEGVETNGFYTVTPSRANYLFSPSQRSFSQLGESTEAAFTGQFNGDSLNPLDTAEYFVRQQYVDILGREPEEGGLNYWSDRILECGSDVACTSARRRDVAAAFFIEQEFQRSGSFIYGLYKGALGRRPIYGEFSSDRQQIVEGPNLEAMKQAFAESFVGRAEFASRYQANTSAASFVDALLQNVLANSGFDLSSQRAALIDSYNLGANLNQSRALALRGLAESGAFQQAEYNGAFVLTEYFGYLVRDPEPAGYAFWLDVLNNREPGNFRGMVCAFINSAEYQRRFSAIVSRSDQECGQ